MMKTVIALTIATLTTASVYAAETYNLEAGMQYGKSSSDANSEVAGTSIGGTYYLKPVVLDGTQPFAELDVLQKASNVSIQYVNMSVENDTFAKGTVNPVMFNGTFYVDNFVLGFSNFSYDKNFNAKSSPSNYYKFTSSSTSLNVGYWVLPNTVVSFENEKLETTYTRSTNSLSNISNADVTTNTVSSHTVSSLGGTQSLVLDLAYRQIKTEQSSTKNNKEYAAKLRFYPEAKYFIEGGYTINTGGLAGEIGKTLMIGTGYAFTPRLVALLATSKFNVDDNTLKTSNTQTTLSVGYRF